MLCAGALMCETVRCGVCTASLLSVRLVCVEIARLQASMLRCCEHVQLSVTLPHYTLCALCYTTTLVSRGGGLNQSWRNAASD